MTSVMPVSVAPGQTALAVTPRRPRSTASERVKPISACLDVAYGPRPRPAASPSVDATLTMRPAPLASRSSRHARTVVMAPVRFTASARSHSRTYPSSSRRPPAATPAALTSTSTGPYRSRTPATAPATAAGSVTSTGGSPPRSKVATSSPSATSRSAVARPIPLPPPVTIATRLTPGRPGVGRRPSSGPRRASCGRRASRDLARRPTPLPGRRFAGPLAGRRRVA